MSWWYPEGLPPARPAPPDLPIFRLRRRFLEVMKAHQVLGGSIYSANVMTAPGVIRNNSPERNELVLDAIAPGREGLANPLRATLEAAGIGSPPVNDIRRTIWSKLVTNMSGSAIALATEHRSSISRTDPALGETYLRVVREGMDIARAHGYSLDEVVNPDRLRAGLLDHKPSLLQDYEQRRPMEIAEIIAAPVAFARAQNVMTPTLDALAAIVTRRARDRGLI
jgi:2-dehydropantoate 2-reductase